ncbi:MAG: hypothetical protein Fur009_3550 [Candidatus Microgenomates bacterium]
MNQNRKEVYYLLDSQSRQTKAIEKLINEFALMLPSHFGEAYFVPSPMESLPSVLRANCSNPKCSVRAIVHLERGENGVLRIKEERPLFDRFSNACELCKEL